MMTGHEVEARSGIRVASKHSKAIRLGDLIDSTLTAREQTQILTRLQASMRRELQAVADKRAAAGRKRKRPPTARQAKARAAAALVYGDHPSAQREQDEYARAHTTLREGLAGRGGLEGAVREDRAAAIVARHQPGRAAYWTVTGPAPTCSPGDTETASIFYRRVLQAIEQGGWTHSERSALAELARKWRPRADGSDARFMVAGTAAGRLPKGVEARINAARKREP